MDKVTLLPCPFCGTAPVMRKWHGGAPTKVMIHCLKDDCDVSPQVPGDTQVIAVDRWNTRATPAPDSEKLREALEPFAGVAVGEVWQRFSAENPTLRISSSDGSRHLTFVSADWFERAAAALGASA